jgi:hypothetical protein
MRFAPLTRLFAPADSTGGHAATGPVMEIASFRLMPSVSDADFLSAAQATEAVVAAQPGFLRRSLLRDDQGIWIDMVTWQSLPLAQTAAETVVADPAFAPFGAAIAMESLSMRHLYILWQMPG